MHAGVSVPPSSGAPLFRMPSAEDPVLPVHLSWMRGRVRGFINAEPRGRTLSLKKRTRHRSTAFRSQLRSISVRFDRPDEPRSRSCGTSPEAGYA